MGNYIKIVQLLVNVKWYSVEVYKINPFSGVTYTLLCPINIKTLLIFQIAINKRVPRITIHKLLML